MVLKNLIRDLIKLVSVILVAMGVIYLSNHALKLFTSPSVRLRWSCGDINIPPFTLKEQAVEEIRSIGNLFRRNPINLNPNYGYKILYGTNGQYNFCKDVGSSTSVKIWGLTKGVRYNFTVVAYKHCPFHKFCPDNKNFGSYHESDRVDPVSGLPEKSDLDRLCSSFEQKVKNLQN